MAATDDLSWAPARELAALVARRAVSPVELVEHFLARIEAIDPKLGAYLTVCADQARSSARDSEAAVLRGEALGPLHGVPVAVKDEAWTRGVRSTAGSKLFENFMPQADGVVAARLRQAGAILLGKTNVPEFMGWSRTANRLARETVNPWDVRRSPGASSGGSGAALAAGLAPIAIGSDGGGSIRIPSALNGVQGLFPTPGRVPDTGSFSYSAFASLGPMARDTRDLALLYGVIAGPDGRDLRLDRPAPDAAVGLEAGVAGLRLAWTPDFGYIRVEPGVAELTARAARGLERAGAHVEEPGLRFPNVWEWLSALGRGEARFGEGPADYLHRPEFLAFATRPQQLSQLTEYGARSMAAAPVSREAWAAARARTEALRRQMLGLFERYDAILSPTMPVVAPVLPEGLADPYPEFCCGTYFTALANVTRLPAASVPCGFSQGLPVGLQIIAPPEREDLALRLARAVELQAAPQVEGRRPDI